MAESTQKAVRWYPPSYDIRVENVPMPKIIHPDDAIVKVQLAGLCGSDLHVYRGTEGTDLPVHTCGHEIVGSVVELGQSFTQGRSVVENRPTLYSSLKVGDKVVAPFTANCGECGPCRQGFTCRCIHNVLFGSPSLDGCQAQYVRIPYAGGTLFSLNTVSGTASDESLLLMADILPTGLFAATQALNHPKILPFLSGYIWPYSASTTAHVTKTEPEQLQDKDRTLTFAVIGLGPVGTCALISLFELLYARDDGLNFKVVGVDLNESRRAKMEKVYKQIYPKGTQYVSASPDEATRLVDEWTGRVGFTAVLEIVGNPHALTLAYKLIRPFGAITSVGVYGPNQVFPLTGANLYDKNISLDFGRCPVRSMIPAAYEILLKRQDIFGKVGEDTSLIEKVVSLDEAKEAYRAFEKGEVGKTLFDPWN